MEERRQYIRINKFLSISYRRLKDFMRTPSRSEDISEGGIRLSVFQRLEPGTVLSILVNLKEFVKPIEAIGEVVWLKERNNSEYRFDAGIKFIKIDPSECKRLSKYLIEIKKQQDSPIIEWFG